MDLKLQDVARLLDVSSDTVRQWVKDAGLPAYEHNEQYHFNSVELQEWALERRLKFQPELSRVNAAERARAADLVAALQRGGVFPDLPGGTRDEVLASMSRLPAIPGEVDRELLYELLVTREAMSSTALGSGVAIPHPRSPMVLHLSEPMVLAAYLRQPVDFRAIDGQPVKVVFLVLSTTVQEHLQLLAQISFALHDRDVLAAIEARAPASKLVELLGALREKGRRR